MRDLYAVVIGHHHESFMTHNKSIMVLLEAVNMFEA